MVGFTTARLPLVGALSVVTAAASDVIRLPGAAGSGPFEAVKDWITAFESRYPEADFTVSSVGSGAAQGALWGDVNCQKKPVEGLCLDDSYGDPGALATKTVWGIGGGTFDAEDYEAHSARGLQQLPALGGPILVTYSRDVTGDLGSRNPSAQLNLSLENVAGIFNNTIDRWNHPAIVAENPQLDLPAERITVLVRSDKSGMSQTFTEAIRHAVPSWPEDGVGKTPDWPLANLTLSSSASAATACVDKDLDNNLFANGSDASLAAGPLNFKADGQTGIGIGLLRRPYSIGYLELGYYSTLTQFVAQAHVSSPNNPGDYEAATPATIRATMGGLVDELEPATLSVTLVDNPTPTGGYSVSRYVYWYVKTAAEEYESCTQAWLLYRFLVWTFTDPLAEEIALSHGWVTIPRSVADRALEKLNQMRCVDPEGEGREGGTVLVASYTPPAYRVEPAAGDDGAAKIILPAVLVPLVVLAAIVAYAYVEVKKRSMDDVWSVKVDELKFDEPPEIVGRGTFGLVLLAEYRGTQVAVKRVIPPKMKFQPDARTKDGTKSSGSHSKGTDSGTNGFRRAMLGRGDMADDLSAEDSENMLMSGESMYVSGGFDVSTLTRRLSTEGLVSTDPKFSQTSSAVSVNSVTEKTASGQSRSQLSKRLSDNLEFPESPTDEDRPEEGKRVDEEVGLKSQSRLLNASKPVRSSRSSTRPSLAGRFRFRKKDEYRALKAEFVQEMRHLSTLRHPCITTVMGAVIERGVEPMLVMEYMQHGSLYDILHNDTVPIDKDMVFSCLQDICQGLRFLHVAEPQIIHGDLKAQNILVDRKFRYKVADFGLSQKKAMAQKRNVAITGTPYWMAPELLRGTSENTASSDVFSFGVILFEVYSRQEPYEGENGLSVLRDICDRGIQKRPPVPDSMPPAVAGIMRECLLDKPATRPTFEELDLRLKRLNANSVGPDNSRKKVPVRRKSDAEVNMDGLLNKIFPAHIAQALREGRKIEPEHHECVTIFFSDIVGFTHIAREIGPRKVANMLDRLYKKMDKFCVKHDAFNIETIGDAYLAATNLVRDQKKDHVKRIAEFARDVVAVAGKVLVDEDQPRRGHVQIRVGFHSGPVIADVLGTQQAKYSIFGDTVNTASRMESTSKPGRIQCSMASAHILMEQAPNIPVQSRGTIRVKGKGEMHTFWVFGEDD